MATGRYVHRFDIDDRHSLHIYQGSLVEVQADALVSSDDNCLSAGGGVSAALDGAAGEDVRRERFKVLYEKPLRLGDVVRTSGGGLSCRHLYHAITIEDFTHFMDETALRLLVRNLLKQATDDDVRTLGMPALGTGVAGFDIAQASQVIIEELLGRLVDTPIRHLVLALIGDETELLFYEELVRANAPRCAALSLRRIEKQLADTSSVHAADTANAVLGENAPYQIRVYENQQLLHTFECEGVVELGRQAEGENGPFRQKRDAGRTRLVIAHLNEPSLSRKHVLIEPIAEDRFRITNLSGTQPLYSLEGGEVKFQTARELAAPVVLTLGKKTLRIQPAASSTEGLQASAEAPVENELLPSSAGARRGPSPPELAEETGEQFPSLIDETRLARTPADRPKLVAGLAALLSKHADRADIEQELLSRPECYRFAGTVEERLMEFLYLSEKHLRTALGPVLFNAKDLRRMAEELGEDCELARDPEQLIDLILRALCFNLLAPPTGLTQYVARVEQLILDLDARDVAGAQRLAAGVEAAKVLERVLKDLLRLYGLYLFGPGFEQELVRFLVVPARRDGSVTRLTLGQGRDALSHLEALVKKNANLRERLARLGGHKPSLLPGRFTVGHTGQAVDCEQILADFIRWRNWEVHDDPGAPQALDQRAVREQLEHLRAFLIACRDRGIYPDVLRYEGTFENRNGERFVHFLDERNTERKVRTDEKIDPRCHYYCFATNNPVHLFPVLIPKL